MILEGGSLKTRVRLERPASCTKGFRFWCSASMLSFCMTVCRLQTAQTDDRTQFCIYFFNFLSPSGLYVRRVIKKIIIVILMPVFIVLSSWQGQCESSLGSCDECRPSSKWLPTLRPSQLTCTVSPPVGYYHPYLLSPFIIVTQPKGWYSCHHPTEGRRLCLWNSLLIIYFATHMYCCFTETSTHM